jgi:hypothetical protein
VVEVEQLEATAIPLVQTLRRLNSPLSFQGIEAKQMVITAHSPVQQFCGSGPACIRIQFAPWSWIQLWNADADADPAT